MALASGHANDDDALPIRADARVLGATLRPARARYTRLGDGRRAYLVPASGKIDVDGIEADARDGVAIRDVGTFTVTALSDSEVILVDTAA